MNQYIHRSRVILFIPYCTFVVKKCHYTIVLYFNISEFKKVGILKRVIVFKMENRRKPTPIHLVASSLFFGLCVILQYTQVVYKFLVVKIVNLIGIVCLSSAVGAFIREVFILKEEKKKF